MTISISISQLSLLLAVTLLLIIPNALMGFVIPSIENSQLSRSRIQPTSRSSRIFMSKDANSEKLESEEEEEEDELDLEPVFAADVRGRPAGEFMEDLDWRIQRLRLEEANKKRFLKSGPRFLPYDDVKKWVQAWGERWTTEEEWKEWIAAGEKRNSYIPSRPDEYFTRTGDWVSWVSLHLLY